VLKDIGMNSDNVLDHPSSLKSAGNETGEDLKHCKVKICSSIELNGFEIDPIFKKPWIGDIRTFFAQIINHFDPGELESFYVIAILVYECYTVWSIVI